MPRRKSYYKPSNESESVLELLEYALDISLALLKCIVRPICKSLSPGGVSCGACHCYLAARRHVSRRLVPHGTVLVFPVFPGDVHSCRFLFRFATTPKD